MKWRARIAVSATGFGAVTGWVWTLNGSSIHAAAGTALVAFAAVVFGGVVAGRRG